MLFGIRWGSLRIKIIAWSFVPTMIILVIVAVVIFYAYQDVTEDLVIERNQDLTRLAAGQFKAGLQEHADLLNTEARTPDIYENDPAAQRDALRGASNRLAVFDAGVLILDTFGTVVAVEPGRPEVLGQDWSHHTYYREILRSQMRGSSEPVFSDIVADGPGGSDVIVVAVPIIGARGEFVGAIAGMFRVGATNVSAFYGSIVRLRLGEIGSAYLVDGQGLVIFDADSDRIGDHYSTQPVVQQVLTGEVGAFRTRDLDGREIVASFAPVPGTSWGLVVEESWATLTSGSRGYGQFLLLLLGLGVTVPIIVATVGVRRITKPIVELIGAAQEVAKGSFGRTITARTGDEVEELAKQFNMMSAQLQESYTHLEQRVADRTQELEALNAIAAVVSRSLDLQEILEDALAKTLEVTELEAGGIYLLQDKVLTIVAHKGLDTKLVGEIDNLEVGEGFSGRVVQTSEPMVVRNLSTDPRLTRSAVREAGFESVAIVPLVSRRKVLGSLFGITRSDREFPQRDIELLASIGHQIGVAVENARLFNAEQRRAEQFRVIAEVGRDITSILAVDELLDQMTRLIKEALEYYLVGIALIEEDELVFRAGAGSVWETPEFEPPRIKVGQEGITGWVAGSGEPLLVPDVSQEPRYYVLPEASEMQSELAVPLKTKDRVIGVLHAQSDRLNAFDESDLVVLQSLANQAAIAIENARLFNAEQRRAEQFRVISEVDRRIASILAVDELLEQMARLIRESFNYYAVGIGLVEGDEVVYKAGAGAFWDDTQLHQYLRLKVGQEGTTGWVAESGEPLLVPDVSQEPRYYYMPEASETRSELMVPMKAKGAVIGVLGVQSDRLNAFDENDLFMLQSLANQAAVIIENVRLFEAEQRRAEQFRVISEMGRHITSILDVDKLLEEIIHLIRKAFGYYLITIGLIEGDEVVFKAGVKTHWPDPRFCPPPTKVGGKGITAWVAATGEPLLAPDVSQEPRFLFLPDAAETRSELAVPLKTKTGVIGVLNAESDQLNAFDESDLAVLQSLAHQAAVAIENARLFRDTARQVRELHALADASRIISSELDQDQLLQAIYEQVTHIAPTDFYLIALYDEATNVVSIEINVDEGVHYPKEQYVLDKGLLKLIIHNRQPLRFDSLTEEKHKLGIEIVPSGSPKVNQGWLGVPMLYGDKVMGAIVVGSYQRGVFDEGHQQTLTSIANQAAVAFENARLYEQARQLAVLEERNRLARDLHDSVTQALYGVTLYGEAAARQLSSGEADLAADHLRELRDTAQEALQEMRLLIFELRPPVLQKEGLVGALQARLEAVEGRAGLKAEFRVAVDEERLPVEIEEGLYRIAQEALNNALRHAQAQSITVSLRQDQQTIILEVTDDGVGFDPTTAVEYGGLGLDGMEERTEQLGGHLTMESRLGEGTTIRVEVDR